MSNSLSNMDSKMSSYDAPTISTQEFEQLSGLIRKVAGISLADGKRDLVRTRLRKRLVDLKLATYGDYFHYLTNRDHDGQELSEMINCITTNKTDFFRESHHFDFLKQTFFPELSARASNGRQRKLRIWSAGCSTGEEPYTIAITVREFFQSHPGWDIRILASDIDSNCLAKASAGVYDEDRIEDIPIDIKRKYFLRGTGESAGKVSVRPELRNMITFRRINFATQPWPIQTKFDIIFCRNVMIYFERDFQETLIEGFVRYLSPDGFLILGHSENVNWMSDVIQPLGKTIYRPTGSSSLSTDTNKTSNLRPSVSTRSAPTLGTTSKPAATPVRPSQPAPATSAGSAGKLPTKKPTSGLSQPVNRPGAVGTTKPAQGTGKRSPNPSAVLQERTGVEPIGRKAIVAGEVFASNEDVEISTLLGSCIAACLYDPVAKCGGMNHFLLPEGSSPTAAAACYGINAMELLINELMKLGGDRNRLEAKLFGGAKVLHNELQKTRVGLKNTEFVKKYLATEGIPITGEQVCGDKALRVYMLASTGEVVAQELDATSERKLAATEDRYANKTNHDAEVGPAEQIVLF